jgi:hypothetical protein
VLPLVGEAVNVIHGFASSSKCRHLFVSQTSFFVIGWISQSVLRYFFRWFVCCGEKRSHPLIRAGWSLFSHGVSLAFVHFGWFFLMRGVGSTTMLVASPSPGCSTRAMCQSVASSPSTGRR